MVNTKLPFVFFPFLRYWLGAILQHNILLFPAVNASWLIIQQLIEFYIYIYILIEYFMKHEFHILKEPPIYFWISFFFRQIF